MTVKAKVQYTVRDVPVEVDEALRRRAARQRKSLNQEIVDTLAEVTLGGKRFADFRDLLGTWQPDAAFDEVIAAQRRIDRGAVVGSATPTQEPL